jgi:chromosome segregation ATPase
MLYDSHQRTCAKVGVTPDFDSYVAGRAEGLRSFCIPEAGFRRALSGASYENQCPGDLAAAYIDAHEAGRRAYTVLTALRSAESHLSGLEYDRREIGRDIEKAERELADPKIGDERRKQIRDDIQRMDRERRRINDDIVNAERTLRLYAGDLDRTRYEIGDRWGAW